VDSPLSPPASCSKEYSGCVTLLTAECQRAVIASSLVEEEIANAILSLGFLSSEDEAVLDSNRFGANNSSPGPKSNTAPLPLQIHVSRTEPAIKYFSSRIPTTVVTLDIPSVHIEMSKPLFDGLQLWADDVSQLVERIFGGAGGDTDTERAESRNPSLIGSRFFAKSRRYGSRSSQGSNTGFNDAHAEAPSETVIKIVITEGSPGQFS
jgi:autophagy-related protein 2